MAFGFFKKDKPPEASPPGPVAGDARGESSSAGAEVGTAMPRDVRKSRAWFDRAGTVADARNYDYAIDCYLSGLKFEADKLAAHEALYEVAKRRMVSGGKPAGMMDKLKSGGKDPIDRMLHAEALWIKDPKNVPLLLTAMERTAEAESAYSEHSLAEVVYWLGERVLELGVGNKKVNKGAYLKTRDLFAQIEAYDKAVEAAKLALQLDEDDVQLLQSLKDLEAERTMKEGGYGQAAGKEGGFKLLVKDMDKQQDLANQDAMAKTVSQIDQLILRRRAELEESPEDLDRVKKLVDVLIEKGTDESENEAAKLLRSAWEETGQYRFKVRVGDVQMRQMNRHLRDAKAAMEAAPDDAGARARYQELASRKLRFELEEFQERVRNYPTDMALRFELGKRLFVFRKFDEAIAAFQEAQADPRHRPAALEYLGHCYLTKGWLDEAIDSLRKGVETHPLSDDRLGMGLRYTLMDALEQSARKSRSAELAREASKVGSQVLQTNINYRDIRQRVEGIRKLIDELS